MDVMQAIRERRSVRRYQSRPVPAEVLTELLEAARLAPSANNKQAWRFIVVRDPEKIKKLAFATGQVFVGTAPVIIAGVSLNNTYLMSCQVPSYAVDVAIAMTNITLVATAHGLGTCWIGAFNQEQVKQILDIPDRYKVVELMTLGYAADEPGKKNRKPLEEIVSYDRF